MSCVKKVHVLPPWHLKAVWEYMHSLPLWYFKAVRECMHILPLCYLKQFGDICFSYLHRGYMYIYTCGWVDPGSVVDMHGFGQTMLPIIFECVPGIQGLRFRC